MNVGRVMEMVCGLLDMIDFGDDLVIVSTWVGCCGYHCCREIDLVYSWYWYVLLVCD